NSKKNFSESFPVGPPGSTACLAIQRSHSSRIRAFASCCFIGARFPATESVGVRVIALARVMARRCQRRRALKTFFVAKGSRDVLNLSELFSRVQNQYGQRIPFSGRNFDSDSDDFPRAAWLG